MYPCGHAFCLGLCTCSVVVRIIDNEKRNGTHQQPLRQLVETAHLPNHANKQGGGCFDGEGKRRFKIWMSSIIILQNKTKKKCESSKRGRQIVQVFANNTNSHNRACLLWIKLRWKDTQTYVIQILPFQTEVINFTWIKKANKVQHKHQGHWYTLMLNVGLYTLRAQCVSVKKRFTNRQHKSQAPTQFRGNIRSI